MSSNPQFEAPEAGELCDLLPAYDVQTFIAKGGMGAVYRARQKSLDRDVAIKILPREFGEDEDFRKRFEAEAKAMARLNHPNLIGVYDFGEVGNMPYIVMEYVDGKSLHHSAHGKAIDQREAGRLALGICDGLAHAHEAGILHRDIKPANILLDSRARPKIGDFGLARAVEPVEGDELMFGTPGYTAPEVIKDPSSVGKRSDVFSTGVILYELLTGELPGKQYVPASQVKKVDPRFDRIIRRATHPSPTLRYADGAAMATELKALLEILNKPTQATMVTQAAKLAVKDDDDGAETEAPKPTSIPTQVVVHHGGSWALLRSMMIIAILLAAIYGMWEAYKWKQSDIARKHEEQRLENEKEKQQQAAALEAARLALNNRPKPPLPNNNTNTGPGNETPVPPEPEPEKPLEALDRLQRKLVDGQREEFPPGTEERGTSRFFFVETQMSWQDAATFAEEHGGHLATCPTEPESNWLASKIPNNATVWLGGGAVGRNDWGWIDGSSWTHRKASVSTGTSAALSSLGTLKALPPGGAMPFFIQWHMDGSNPGTLTAQLDRTRETLPTPSPVYPPGTFTLDSRHYLLVGRHSTWQDALKLAQLAEGHLAVPSDAAEIEFLKSLADKSLPAGGSCWIGGQHNGRSWAWITGEPWAVATWAPDSPDGDPDSESALRIVSGDNGGWDDADPTDEDAADALLIEWSKDSTVERTAEVPTASGELARVRKIGADAVGAKKSAYEKELFAIGKDFKWDLDFWHRGMGESPKAAYAPGVARMKELVGEDGSLPADMPRAGMPVEASRILDGYLDKQKRLHESYLSEIERLRVAYLKRLQETRAELEERGLKDQVEALDNEIDACGDDPSGFLEHFTGTAHRDPSEASYIER